MTCHQLRLCTWAPLPRKMGVAAGLGAGSAVQALHTCMDERLSVSTGARAGGCPEAPGSVPLLPQPEVGSLCGTFSPGPSSTGAVGVRVPVP